MSKISGDDVIENIKKAGIYYQEIIMQLAQNKSLPPMPSDLYDADKSTEIASKLFEQIFEHPEKYGFKLNPDHVYHPEELRTIEVHETIANLVTFAKQNGSNYKILKRHNPWLRQPRLTVKKGKVYQILLPV